MSHIALWGFPLSLLHFISRRLDTFTLGVENKTCSCSRYGFTSPSATMPHSTSPPQAPPTSLHEPWCEEEFCSSLPTIPLQVIFNCAACIPHFTTHTQCIYCHAQTNHINLAHTPNVDISHTTNGKYIPTLKSEHTRTLLIGLQARQ